MAASVARRAAKPRVNTWAVANPSNTKAMPRAAAMMAQTNPNGPGSRIATRSATKAATARRGNRILSGRLGQGRVRRCEMSTTRPASQRLNDSMTTAEPAMATGATSTRSTKLKSPGSVLRPNRAERRPAKPRQVRAGSRRNARPRGRRREAREAPPMPRSRSSSCATGYHSIARSPTLRPSMER